ncbi:MAG TPA: hypothetical protein DDY71_16725 [Spirochaetia bacterium]|nr:hypothetical protein [Spirochaetia bacterium]HBI39288.1 hypothetical protein [Spirochaetia bacterium]
MEIKDKIKGIFDILKIIWNNKALHNDLSYYSFILSLLPIHGLQQTAQVFDKIFSNKELNLRFEDLWQEINSINSKLKDINDLALKYHEIAGIVKYNENLNNKISLAITDTIQYLKNEKSEWTMLTEDWSYQEVINSIVTVDYAQIISINGSKNIIENTEIKANRTLLHASDKSKNYVNNTTFTGLSGAVGMNNVATEGNIVVEDSGIGFGNGGAIYFGDNPHLVNGKCPFCNTEIQIDKRKLIGYSQIKCFNCKKEMPFTLN